MIPPVLHTLFVLLAVAFVGRVVLAMLPVGALGAHGARELPGTWAASHLLGLGVFAAQQAVARELELPAEWRTGWAFVLPWVVVAIARVLALPGALVPRHEPRGERAPGIVFALGVVSLVLATTPWWVEQGLRFDDAEPRFCAVLASSATEQLAWRLGADDSAFTGRLLDAASVVSVLVLVAAALATARRAPIARALAVLWLAWLVFLARGLVADVDRASLLLTITGGAAAMVPWLRRGDRRALAVAALAFGMAASLDVFAWVVSLASLCVLFLASPRSTWRTAALWCGIGAVPVMLEVVRHVRYEFVPLVQWTMAPMLVTFLVPAFAIAASAYALRVLVLRRSDPRERIDPTTREASAVGAVLVLGSIAALWMHHDRWVVFAEGMPHVPEALLPFLGLVPMLVGLVGAPDERTLPPA